MAADELAAVLHCAGDLRIEPRELSAPGEHELLVEVAAVGICGSDVHYFEHGELGPNVVRAPHILGHEVSGRVVALGAKADGKSVGDRVVIEPGLPCQTCADCASGRYNLCTEARFLGAPPVDGALRGHLTVDAAQAFTLPDSVSDQAGALIEPLAVAVWACRRGSIVAGHRVLVIGAGPVGLLVAQVAAARGASVMIVDINEHRVALARRLGVSEACSATDLAALPDDGRADVLFECSGSVAALAAGLDVVRPGGTVVIVGMAPEGLVTFPLTQLQRRELTVIGSFRYVDSFPEAVELAASGRIALEPLITSRYPLEETAAALGATKQDAIQVKAVVLPGLQKTSATAASTRD